MTVGSVALTWPNDNRGENRMKIARLTCTGDVSNGSIPNTDFNNADEVTGWYLYAVKAYPSGVEPLPDAADVFILDENDLDLLGSVDGGTTAYNGLNLIHATLTKMNIPSYLDTRAGSNLNFHHMITGTLTLKVSNQGTASANYVIECMFIR